MVFSFPSSPVDGQVVTETQPDGSVLTATYAASKNGWTVTRQPGPPTTVEPVGPIDVTPTAHGQVVMWDANLGTWVAAAIPPARLEDLANVQITDPQEGDVLTYVAADQMWINLHLGPEP